MKQAILKRLKAYAFGIGLLSLLSAVGFAIVQGSKHHAYLTFGITMAGLIAIYTEMYLEGKS